MLVVELRYKHHARYGHDLQALIRPDRIELQREVGQDNESAKGGRHGQHLNQRYVHMLVDIESIADHETQEGHNEVNAGQGHVREAVLNIDVLVELNDRDGRDHIDRQTDRHYQIP